MCTNYMNKCALCKCDVWLYNTEHHYEDMHPGVDIPELDKDEIADMKKKKIITKIILRTFSAFHHFMMIFNCYIDLMMTL